MNEQPTEYWKTEEFKWSQIRELIESLKQGQGLSEMYKLARDEKYTLVQPDEVPDYETNLYTSFEQKDGYKVEITRGAVSGLSTIEEALFLDIEGNEVFKLSDVIPEDYTIVEGGYIGRDFMNSTFKCIVLHPGFLESIGGRLAFIHELGHASDFNDNPLTRQEFLESIHKFDNPQRETDAWKRAKNILEEMRQKGLRFLPDWFEESELESWVEFMKKNHNYPATNTR